MTLLDYTYFSVEFFITNSILFLLWAGVYLNYKINSVGSSLVSTSLFVALLGLFILFNTLDLGSAVSIFRGNYSFTSLISFLKFLVLFTFIIFSLSTLRLDNNLTNLSVTLEIILMRLTILLTMLLILSTNDLVYFFFALELYSLSAYVLIAYQGKTNVFSAEAAMKYFVLGTSFSVIISYGIALIYLTTGITNFDALEAYVTLASNHYSFINDFNLFQCGITLFLMGLMFKIAAAPFHSWAPDVYDGAPLSVMHFLNVIPKIALLSFFLKFSFLTHLTSVTSLLLLSALLSLLLGSVGGLFQKRVKRLLAYSAINNNGFFLLTVVLGYTFGSSMLIFFLIIYTLTLVGTFAILQTITPQANPYSEITNLWSWTNLVFIRKVLSLSLIFLLFSSAGIPPFVGFMAKFMLLFTTLASSATWYFIVLVALLLSALSCFYYIRVTKVMAFVKKPVWIFLSTTDNTSAYVISVCVFLTLLLFITSGSLLNLILLIVI